MLLAAPLAAQVAPQEPTHRLSSPIAYFDDAEVPAPGVLSLGLDFSYGSVEVGSDTSFPGFNFALGLHERFDVSGSAGYVRSRFEDLRVNGVGDAYLGIKAVVLTEGERRPGVAVKPMVEVLGEPSIENNPLAPDRVNWMLPVMVQKSFEQFRIYYTTGYYSRGIVFHSLAYEINRWSRVIPTIVVWHAQLTTEQKFVSELGLNRSRSDVFVGAGVPLATHWSVYGNVSRSFGRKDPNSSRYQISAGISYYFSLWRE